MVADYQNREYLSASEVAIYTGLSVRQIHAKVKTGEMPAFKSAGGQYRFRLREVRAFRQTVNGESNPKCATQTIQINHTVQKIILGDARNMSDISNDSAHLAITSPPYFNAKMYGAGNADLGDIHDLTSWLDEIGQAWAEVFRVLQPGRKFFLNIMNLPVRENKSFRTIDLVGKNIALCETIGFILKRDIIWHKTNGVRAHFGTYPNPGGILINNMHEFILEFQKPAKNASKKYAHVSDSQRAQSKLDKDFWLSIKNSDVWLMKPEKSGGNREHSAPFPLELPERLIRAFSYVGETVLDPFVGSGTTLAAAAMWRRNGIGVDINPKFCQMAARRVAENL